MSFTCTARVASGPATFVPPRLASPFDPSTSSAASGNALPDTSDCGSSSGLGGMKTQELNSDEGGSSSSDVACGGSSGAGGATNFYAQRPTNLSTGPPSATNGSVTSAGAGSNILHPAGLPPPPNGLPMPPPFVSPSSGAYGGIPMPSWSHPMPPGASNDIYVHIQPGESLTIYVGPEKQTVNGPATIRMAGEAGIAASALPIFVPPGHMIHQLVDEQGMLRHLILSPEPAPTAPPVSTQAPRYPYNNNNNKSGGIRHGASPPLPTPAPAAAVPPVQPVPQPPPAPPSNFYTYTRSKWNQPPHATSNGRGENGSAAYHRDDDVEADIDSEERERVLEMLARIHSPQVVKVTPTEAEIAWQELDTSEAAANGPFPQLDASEFKYSIVLFENQGRFVSTYKCLRNELDPASSRMRLCQLRPNTDYYVQLKASLDERGIAGEPSQPVFFKTLPGRPDPPIMPKMQSRTSDGISMSWRPPNNNGLAITSYCIYMSQPNSESREKVWEGSASEARVVNLRPATTYRFRVSATNPIGESQESPPLLATTHFDQPPPQPDRPAIVSVTMRCVKLTFATLPEHTYSIEMHDVSAGPTSYMVVRERITSSTAQITDLVPGCDYRFRLQAHNSVGDSLKSEWTYVKTTGRTNSISNNNNVNSNDRNEKVAPPPAKYERSERSAPERSSAPAAPEPPPVPEKPRVVHQTKRKTEIAWKCAQTAKDTLFHLEGSSKEFPLRFRTLYRGPLTSHTVTEEQIQNVRVQTVTRRGVASEFSDTLELPVYEDPITKPAQLRAPTVEAVDKGSVKLGWSAAVNPSPSAALAYEVRRIDHQSEMIYSGSETSCSIVGLGSREHIEVQVRAVLISKEGVRFEGEWSALGSGWSARDAPATPTGLRLSEDSAFLEWSTTDSSSDLRYRVSLSQIAAAGEVSETTTSEVFECRYSVAKLDRASNYKCTIAAVHDGGESSESEALLFTTPPGAPAQPESVSLEAESATTLLLKWSTPDARGAPIKTYHIHVESKSDLHNMVRDSTMLAGSSSDECEFRIANLYADTPYRVEVAAENEVGRGSAAAINARTRSLPPEPPKLECDAEATIMRLKWKSPGTHSCVSYKVVRLNENGTMSTVYEGDQCHAKLRGLQENSEYSFQIRCADRTTGFGPWSETFVFRTSLLPPPALKIAPTATPSGTFFYQIDWQQAIVKPNVRKCFYRLQAVDCSLDNAKWLTVYEGQQCSYSLRTSDYPSAVQARVLCVRPSERGEMVSAPSPVVYIANNQSRSRKESRASEEESKPSAAASLLSIPNISMYTTILAIFVTLIVLAFVCSYFFDQIFTSTGPTSPPPVYRSSVVGSGQSMVPPIPTSGPPHAVPPRNEL